MPNERNTVLFRLGGDCEVGFTREVVIHLDAIPVLRLQIIHGSAGLGYVPHDDRMIRVNRWRAIHDRPAGDKPWTQALFLGELLPPKFEFLRVTSCVAYSGHAICEQKWKCEISVPYVHVHIPQAGDEIQSPPVNDLCTLRGPSVARRSDACDATAVDEHRLICFFGCVRTVNHGYMRDGNGFLWWCTGRRG